MTALDEGCSVEILQEGQPLRILGTCLDLGDATGPEIDNRIACAWRMFWAMSKLLLNRDISLKVRLQRFDTTVGSSVLWCTESWAPREEELRRLEAARRSMLRKIHGKKRLEDETWLQWLQRSTRSILVIAEQAGLKPWTEKHFYRKWLWAGHVARHPAQSWLQRVTFWRDSRWQLVLGSLVERPFRPSKRRWMKWETLVHKYSQESGGGHWKEAAQSKDAWKRESSMFAAWAQM